MYVGLVAVGYYVFAYVGTVLSLPPSSFAIIWPATAFLVSVFLVSPPRAWWTFALGVAPAHFLLLHELNSAAPLAVALIQIFGNLALAAATAVAMRSATAGPVRFDGFRGVLAFIVVAVFATPALANAAILGLLLATGWAHDFWLSWRQWMLASMFPTLTFVPLAVLAMRRELFRDLSGGRRGELLLMCPILYGLSYLVFGGHVEAEYWPALLLAPMPMLLWAAVRWGVGGASLALLAFASAVIVRALQGVGPFAAQSPASSILALQVYLTGVSAPLMLLAALIGEWGRTEELLRRSDARIEIAAASTDTGLWQWDEITQQLWLTEHCRAMFGLEPGVALRPEAFLDAVHPDDRSRVGAALRMALTSHDIDALSEFRVTRGGESRLYVARTHAERTKDGLLIRVSGLFRDATPRFTAQRQAEQLFQRLLTLQEAERKSIAEELHDSTGQHLSAAALMVQMLGRRIAPSPETGGLLDDLQASLDAAARELRTFTYLLRPPELDRHGLCDVLRRYVDGYGRRTGLATSARLTPRADALPLEQQRAILRITQECLANVYRHAEASRVSVRLRCEGRSLHLVVGDDGRGLSPGAHLRDAERPNMGVGIPGMRARVNQLGGKLVIRSGARGTRVHVILPLYGAAGPAPPPTTAGRRRTLARSLA